MVSKSCGARKYRRTEPFEEAIGFERKQLEGKLKKVQWPKAYDTIVIRHEDDGSIIARFNLHSCDGGMGSSIATPGIIAVRCVREKCERLLVPDEASYH